MKLDPFVAMGLATAFEVRGHDIEKAAFDVPERPTSLKDYGALGELAACAASLGFATEVYLKVLLSGFGKLPGPEHSLSRLFAMLPDAGRKWAQELYVTELQRVGPITHAITLAVGPLETPLWEPAGPRPGEIATALASVADAFTVWRYPFEVDIVGDSAYDFRYLEYGSLLACCHVFGQMCEELVLKPPSP